MFAMFAHKVNGQIELRMIDRTDAERLFRLIDGNRGYLREWHPWVEIMRSTADVEKLIGAAQQQFANNRGFHAGIWFEGNLCGVVHHLNVDWVNRWTALSYWLDEGHQGKGIMTESCRAMVAHAFETWKLHRVMIECAAENTRSRAIPERLGFKLEGVTRQSEWLQDRFVDHALYGRLKTDRV
jgi:ribosomal-protein-serine acetyltransferase